MITALYSRGDGFHTEPFPISRQHAARVLWRCRRERRWRLQYGRWSDGRGYNFHGDDGSYCCVIVKH